MSSAASPSAGTSTARPTPPAGAVMRRKPAAKASTGRMSSVLNFYTDDSPGLKLSPVSVVIMSFVYIGCVTCMHIIGKILGK